MELALDPISLFLIGESKRVKWMKNHTAVKPAALIMRSCFAHDHGHELLSDILRGTHPGYPLIGWIRGLSELRSIVHPLEHPKNT